MLLSVMLYYITTIIFGKIHSSNEFISLHNTENMESGYECLKIHLTYWSLH